MLGGGDLYRRKPTSENQKCSSEESHREPAKPSIPAGQLFGAQSFCRTCTRYSSIVCVCFIIVTISTRYFSDGPIQSLDFVLPIPPPLIGTLLPNSILSSGDRLLEGAVYGPESLALHTSSKTVYSGLKTGNIVAMKIDDSGKISVYRTYRLNTEADSSRCDGSYSMQPICGRPLGMRFRKQNSDLLLVADAYYGIYEIDVTNGNSKLILKTGTRISDPSNATPLRHLNDLDELDDGRIILSEPSYKFADRDCVYAMTEHSGDGRLLLFDRNKQQLRILVDRLQYPNGVQIVENGFCVLFAEMGNLRILRHCFGDGFSSYNVVIDNLPGYPDNIRLSRNGMLWVPLGQVRLVSDHWITTRAWLRNLIATLTSIRSFSLLIEWASPKYGMVVVVDPNNGSIIRSLHDPSGETISAISQVLEMDNGTLLLGGDSNAFVLRVRL
ncbi:Adipocyte plasma membrane-associated protein [Toxocara canis]|uniref:Adipocyte plasma membrane-associated protein n=1 Tax=Toxocara canis TaxID=6265 RepID=A0A0B2VBQ6_TOXCA|nr:Adipocyte plasma membrane-associated protein [Toxocara canis]